MKIQKLVFSAVCVCFAGASSLPAAQAEGLWDLNQCYLLKNVQGIEKGKDHFTVAQFRQKLLDLTVDKFKAAASSAVAQKPPKTPKKCSSPKGAKIGTSYPSAVKITDKNYFGQLKSKQDFLNVAASSCNGSDQYFSIGDAIYYRNCHEKENNQSGDYLSYIYFWGVSKKSSVCFSGSYPSMYKMMTSDGKTVTAANMQSVYAGGGFTPTDQQGYALADAMSAIQIAESYRDNLVYPINYMLIEMGVKNKSLRLSDGKLADSTPVRIIGGHCPSGTDSVCRNTTDTKDALHPLAWGGAKKYTMKVGDDGVRRWGRAEGATSKDGQILEVGVIMNWLSYKNYITQENSGCSASANSSDIPDATFAGLLP